MRDTSIKGRKTDGSEFIFNIDDWYSLKELSLQEQLLVEVDLFNIMYGNRLEILNLSQNQLSELDLSSLQNCWKLVFLDISGNNLKDIDLSSLRSNQASPIFLKRMDLSNNSILELDLDYFVKCVNLQELNLKNNNITELDLSPLRCCKNLENIQIDSEVNFEWRSTNLDEKSLSKGLKKYVKEIKHAWEEFQKEVENFRKIEPKIEERLKRSIWLENMEKKKKFEWTKIRSFSRRIYNEVRKCYIYECYRGAICISFSLMETFLTNELPFEIFLQEKGLLKKNDKSQVEPKKLNLSKLAKVAKKHNFISPDLYKRIYFYLPVRHNIVHYPDSQTQLGFYRTSIRGTGTRSRGVGFESPDRIPMLPPTLQEAAERGILLFLDLMNELKS